MYNQAFLQTFKAIELDLRVELKLPETVHMSFNEMVYRSNRRVFKSQYHQEILENAAQLRNLLAHKTHIATIDASFYNAFSTVARRILDPLRAEQRMVRFADVHSVSLHTTIEAAKAIMDRTHFSHLPVIKDDQCIGMFNRATLFYAVAEAAELTLSVHDSLERLRAVLYLTDHPDYQYAFVSRRDTLDEIAERFSSYLMQDALHLQLVIVTENGKPSETMLGLLTPEDLIDIYMHD